MLQNPVTSLDKLEQATGSSCLVNVQRTTQDCISYVAPTPRGKEKMTLTQIERMSTVKEIEEIKAIVSNIDAIENDTKTLQV